MGTAFDVALGRLAAAQGLVSADVVRRCYDALPPGRSLADDLVARRLLDPARAQALAAQVQAGGAGAPATGRLAPPPGQHPAPQRPSGRLAPAPAGSGGSSSGRHAALARQGGGPAAGQDATLRLPSGDGMRRPGLEAGASDATLQLGPGPGASDATLQLGPGPGASDATLQLGPGSGASDATLQLGPGAGPAAGAAFPVAAPGSTVGGLPGTGDVVADRYEVLDVLGKGGMGAVYRARDRRDGEEVALKVMLSGADASGEALARFRREAEAVARVDAHAGIVRIRDAGAHGGQPYAAMDLVSGRDLSKVIKAGGPLPIEEALRIAEVVCRAVHHCHARGVLHRDLKPANVLLREHDGAPLVTDFGLALAKDQERMTRTGQVMGTPAYMPPEQAEGDKAAVDARSDVYSLGAVLYELVTGRPPFQGEPMQILKKVFVDAPAPVHAARPQAPPDLDVICQKAMAKDKALRYATASDLADDIARLARGEPITARAPTRRELFTWRLRRRERGALAKVGLLLVVLVASILGPIALAHRSEGRLGALRRALDEELPRVGAAEPVEYEREGQREGARSAARRRAGRPVVNVAALQAAIEALVAERREEDPEVAPVGSGAAALERLADDPALAAALGRGSLDAEAERAALRTLARRMRVADGAWTGALEAPTDDASSEDLLMSGLVRLGWGAAAGTVPPADLGPGLALLEAAAARGRDPAAEAAADVRELLVAYEARITEYFDRAEKLEQAIKSLREDDRPRALSGEAWPPFSGPPVPNAWDITASSRFLRLKQAAIERATQDLQVAVSMRPAGRWSRREPYLAVGGILSSLKSFAFVQPETSPDVVKACAVRVLGDVCKIVNPVGEGSQDARPTVEAAVVEAGVSGLILATEGLVSFEGDGKSATELRHSVYGALVLVIVVCLGERRLPVIDVLMLLPRLRHLPTERQDTPPDLYEQALADRRFASYAREHPTAEAFLVWGDVVHAVAGNDDVANEGEPLSARERALIATRREEACALFATALGGALSPELRACLSLPTGERAPLAAELSPYWRPFAMARLALNRSRLENIRRDAGAAPPGPRVHEACIALLEEARHLGPNARVFRELHDAVGGALYTLRRLPEAEEPARRAELDAIEVRWLDDAISRGWDLADYVIGRRTPPGAVEGSLADVSEYNPVILEHLLIEAVVDRSKLHRIAGERAQARALVERAVAHLTGYEGSIATLLMEVANITIDEAREETAAGQADAARASWGRAEVAAARLLEASKDMGEAKGRDRRAVNRSRARAMLALSRASQGDPEGARALVRATCDAGDPLWHVPGADATEPPSLHGHWDHVFPLLGEAPPPPPR